MRRALFCGGHACLGVAVAGALSILLRVPMLFPAFGATAFILVWAPNAPAAAPRSVVLGHFMGATIGWLCARAFELDFAHTTLLAGGRPQHVAAAALALGLTSMAMILLRAPHPPAGATTLIFSLGQIPFWWGVPVVLASVVLLSLQVGTLQRLRGLPYPWWAPAHVHPPPEAVAPSAKPLAETVGSTHSR